MKTEEEIEEIAIRELEDEDGDYFESELEIFVMGYRKAQKDMIESASEGFEEYAIKTYGSSYKETVDKDILREVKDFWQASQLSSEKKQKIAVKVALEELDQVLFQTPK